MTSLKRWSVAFAMVFAAARCSSPDTGSGSTTSTQASSGSEPASGSEASAAPVTESSAPPASTAPTAAAGDCTTDDDCVRDACCHAAACVPRARAPQCTGIMCTRNCAAGTLDCGGSCVCEAGHCAGHRAGG